MRVFPFNLQYQKVLIDLFEMEDVKAYEFDMLSNSTMRSTL